MDLKGSGRSLVEVFFQHFLGCPAESHKKAVRVAGAPAEISTQYLLRAGLGHHRSTLRHQDLVRRSLREELFSAED
jgi:hypothetical protein